MADSKAVLLACLLVVTKAAGMAEMTVVKTVSLLVVSMVAMTVC